jgi:hypothetical protein
VRVGECLAKDTFLGVCSRRFLQPACCRRSSAPQRASSKGRCCVRGLRSSLPVISERHQETSQSGTGWVRAHRPLTSLQRAALVHRLRPQRVDGRPHVTPPSDSPLASRRQAAGRDAAHPGQADTYRSGRGRCNGRASMHPSSAITPTAEHLARLGGTATGRCAATPNCAPEESMGH